MDPKLHQNRAPEAPKTLLEPGCRRKLVSEPFWALFGPPGTPKIVLSLWRGAIFLLIWRHAPGSPKSPPNEPQIEPKTTPRGPRMPKNVAPNRCSNFDQISAPILAILEPQNGTQNRTKNGLRAQGPPKARPGPAQRPPESPSGGILGSFWPQFGPPGAHVRAFSGCTFASFGLLLVYCWCSFSLASSPPLLAF